MQEAREGPLQINSWILRDLVLEVASVLTREHCKRKSLATHPAGDAMHGKDGGEQQVIQSCDW